MKYLSLWMQATTLVAALTLTGCKDDDDNDSGSSTPDTPSAVDNGSLESIDSYVDNTYAPGNNFFMYRNGLYWKNTVVEFERKGFMEDMDKALKQKLETINNPVTTRLKEDAANIDKTTSEAQAYLQKVVEESGLLTATTLQEAWRAVGKQALLGVAIFMKMDVFSKEGKIQYSFENIMPEDMGVAQEDKSAGAKAHRSIYNNAGYLRALVPLQSDGTTRSVNANRWPMLTAVVEGMGIDPKTVYMPDEMSTVYGPFDEESQAKVNEAISSIEKIQNLSLKEFKEFAMAYLSCDSALISSKAMANYNIERSLMSLLSGDVKTLSTSSVIDFMNEYYLNYYNSKLITDQFVTPEMRQHGRAVVEELRAVFRQRIKDNSWMSEASKTSAIDKLDNIVVNVGGPEEWIQAGLPDLSASKSLLEDVYTLRKSRLALLKSLIGMDTKKASFQKIIMDKDYSLAETNAFYYPNFNSVNIYPCWYMEPAYSTTYNQAFNYAMYAVVGHEITHGFDTSGAEINKIGDYGPIWASTADDQEFKRRAQLLIDYYGTFDLLPGEGYNKKANSQKTITEDIADLGGLEIAYQAYCNYLKANGYNGDQMKLQQQRFFYSFANLYRSKYNADFVDFVTFGINNPDGPDTHSMNKERVNGTMSNMDAWHDLFDVKPGQALYRAPADRVHIW